MIHRVRSLVTVLALALPSAASADPLSTFLQQDKYTYCDVKALSQLWKQSMSDAKVSVGVKLEARNTAYLDAELKNARQFTINNPQLRCSYAEAGFSYDDAKKLAAIWKVTTSKAKAMIEEKIAYGGEQSLRAKLRGAAGGGSTQIAQPGEDPTTTFLKQDRYGLCEVKLLSALWKTSAKDAKARIGTKLQTGNEAALRTDLQTVREAGKLKCKPADAGFTAYDVKRMMQLWDLTVADIERKITNGSAASLRGMLNSQQPPEEDVAAFLKQTKYSYCDAYMVGTLWKRSTQDAKAFIGAKLAAKDKRSVDKLVVQARKHAVASSEARCQSYMAGFSSRDLALLAPLWKKPPHEMKAEVALRIAKGQEAQIRAQLKKALAKAPKQPLEMPKQPSPPPESDKPGFDKEPKTPAQGADTPRTKPITKTPAPTQQGAPPTKGL